LTRFSHALGKNSFPFKNFKKKLNFIERLKGRMATCDPRNNFNKILFTFKINNPATRLEESDPRQG